MRTLILEDKALRGRSWVAQFGAADGIVDVARSAGQARLMLLGQTYDRFCLTLGAQAEAGFALLSVARAMNPACEIIDLTSLKRRTVSGPMVEAAEAPAIFKR